MKAAAEQLEFDYSAPPAGAVFTCPAHLPFLPALVEAALDGTLVGRAAAAPEDVLKLTIYVPSLAAVEPLKLAFLKRSAGGASYLPRIRVLGHSDPYDIFAAFGPSIGQAEAALALLEKALAIPPEAEPLRRQFELCAILMRAAAGLKSKPLDFDAPLTPQGAFATAERVASLIDEAHGDSADLLRLERLESGLGSGAEQLSLQLLRETLKAWRALKAKAGWLDSAERRNRLMAVEAEFIRLSSAPVIVAGSSGTVAATVGIMQAALSRPQSAVVLHGLDLDCSNATWEAIGSHPEHPQFALHRLLQRLQVPRERVRALKAVTMGEDAGRAAFLNEALRPASLPGDRCCAPSGPKPRICLIEAGSVQEEAATIALILRDCLELKDRTAALITPNDALIARVRHGLSRWGIPFPAGHEAEAAPLPLRAIRCAASSDVADFVALLRAADGERQAEARRVGELVDLAVLRQMWRPRSLLGLAEALSRAEHAVSSGEARHPALKRVGPAEWSAARTFAAEVLRALAPLAAVSVRCDLSAWAIAHRQVLAGLSALGVAEETAAEASLFEEINKAAPRSLAVDLAAYASLFAELCAKRAQRSKSAPHPRIALTRPLDARLLAADVVVLGGLNEGCWPQASAFDLWLQRRERELVGLAPLERRIGLAAHDFVTFAASAGQVYLTRSRKVNGSLSKPSRWISRIKVLAHGTGVANALEPEKPWLAWAKGAVAPGEVRPAPRPAPRPPVAARPRTLSVTAIETWFANPYAIYARHILGLDPLRRADEGNDPRDRGILYHTALHKFFEDYPADLPADTAAELLRRLDRAAVELGFNLENAPFWRPRFARFAQWFEKTEAGRRVELATLRSECRGKLELAGPAGPFTVTARADRIDIFTNGELCVYDFKTSANAAKTSIGRGAPQLALEGWLAREGAFAGVRSSSEICLRYVTVTGGDPPGEMLPLTAAGEAIEAARTGLIGRIARFDDPDTPYAYEARPIYRERAEYDPYAHLARVAEWSPPAEDSDV